MTNMRRSSENAAKRAAKNVVPQKNEDPMLGAVILRKYQIVDILGEGGMGSVYLARDREGGQEVAVKVLHQSMSSDDAIARFFREVKATITVNHPNIVRVIDHGMYRDKLVCVMERLEGSDLLGILRSTEGRKLPWKRVRPIITQLCGGLFAAHRENIIHRDLKPGNIFIVQNGGGREKVKILDFGLAKNLGDGNDDLTKTDTIMGTFKYMAPEQTLGKKDYDHRADIWAVGVIMYELLTGEVPFKGENILDLLENIKNQHPVRPRVHEREIPGYVEEIILKAMEKDPRKRFQSMRELKEAIVSRSKQSRSLGDLLLANAVEFRDSNPVKENCMIPAEELGVAIIPQSPVKESIEMVSAPEPEFTKNLGRMVPDYDDETEQVRKKGGWLGKVVLIASISAAAGFGYHYWDRISPVVTPYYERARDFVEREIGDGESRPVEERPVATNFRARIETSPINANVYLPGKGNTVGEKVGNTQRPLILNLEKGEHTLIIRKTGYRQSKVKVTPQNPNVKVKLRRIQRRREAPIEIESVEIEGDTE